MEVSGQQRNLYLVGEPLAASQLERGVVEADRVAQLYRRYSTKVYARCQRMLRNTATAEDLTQETFLRVHRSIASLETAERELPWLLKIASNLCLNAIRDAGRAQFTPEVDAHILGRTFDEALADRQLVTLLIARASPKIRATAWLFHVEGMAPQQVADTLQVSRRMVVRRLARFAQESRRYLRAQDQCTASRPPLGGSGRSDVPPRY